MSAKYQLFELEKYHHRILRDISKIGEANKKIITNATNHDIGSRQIGRKLFFLRDKGFVKATKSKQIGNIRKIKEITYGLTFKGLIASKESFSLENNYLIKKYLKNIGNKKVEKLTLDYIESSIEYFLVHNKMRGLGLTNMKNIADWFSIFDNSFGFSKENLEKLNNLKKYRDSCLGKLNKSIKDNFSDKKLNDLGQYVKQWYNTIDLLSSEKSFKKIVDTITEKQENKSRSLVLDKINLVQNENVSEDEYVIKTSIQEIEI